MDSRNEIEIETNWGYEEKTWVKVTTKKKWETLVRKSAGEPQ